ncbi:hypothetical protein BRADI_1g19870v3 [Brachypodium distachyon]|uniref:Uncharacterized protein n=1 Tax=Brachypodium distachyon TaxID=15368 RepID=A0A0Q3JAQ8_BRADI|nr:hypothetical protein BRADI_1g19870v3 [Brachypodium distachyon]KQK14972.1 hypothetical protein BRADI_1g19870v3 [Brachypodium distachyon]
MADGGGGGPRERGKEEEEEDDVVCLDPSFFVDRSYEMTTFTYGSQVLQLLCLRAASTDYDLTGQLVWPGAVLMNTYLSEHPETVKGCSIIELGSGIGITGILCSRFCKEVVLTDHNDEVLEIIKKNVEVQSCSENADAVLTAEKLEWGNYDHINNIIEKHPSGFDLILGADIYILLTFSTPLWLFPIPILYLSIPYAIYQYTLRFVDLDSQKASSNLAFPISLIL